MMVSHGLKAGLATLLAALVLAGCASSGNRYSQARDGYPKDIPDLDKVPNAVPKKEPLSAIGNAPTYEVLGKTYHVLPSAKGYVATGIASFYGTKFNGYSTSNGERYNMYAMTAASKVLPLPTYVKVTNLNNHRSVIVRVNDRGPFNSRIMDLSYVAAYKLGYVQEGTAPVRVEAIDPDTYQQKQSPVATPQPQPEPQPQPQPEVSGAATAPGGLSADEASSLMDSGSQPSASTRYSDNGGNITATSAGAGRSTSSTSDSEGTGTYLQVASITDEAKAEQIRAKLASSLSVQGRIVRFRNFYRIQMGPFTSDSAVEQAREQLNGLGYPNAIIAE